MAGFLLSMSARAQPELEAGLPRGIPVHATEAQTTYATQIYSLLKTHFAIPEGEGDPEDFWEQAARLDSVLQTGAEVWLLENGWGHRIDEEGESSAEDLRARLDHPRGHPDRLLAYGPVRQGDLLWLRPELTTPDRYGQWEAFKTWAGRATELVGVYRDGMPDDAAAVMAAWAKDRVVAEGEEVLLKAREAKHGLGCRAA